MIVYLIAHLKHHGAGHLHHAAAGAVGPHGLPSYALSIGIIIAVWALLTMLANALKGSGRRSAQRYY